MRRKQKKLIQTELELGLAAAEACADKAERVSDFDRESARRLILEKLNAEKRPMSCEDLVDYCRENGVIPHDDHAFGAVFSGLSRCKLIEKAGLGPRRKGHGAPGANWWRIPA